jgi:hypothetical protein
MATRFVTNLDLVQNQILNGRFESVASDPNTGNFEGRMIYNTTEDTIKVYSGSAWRKMLWEITSGTTALVPSETNGTVALTIANVTSSVDGLMSATDKVKLDASTSNNTASTIVFRDSNGDFSANTITAAKVTGLSAPSADTDAANKAYVDAARSGLDVKASVRVATTADISLSNSTTSVDDITLNDGDRILVKDQDTASENGIYIVSTSGAWSRAADADSSAEVTSGLFTFVAEGSANADSGWVLATNDTIVLGTTDLVFNKFSGAGQIIAGLGLSKSGVQSNQLDVNTDGTSIEVDGNDDLRIASGAAGDGLGWSTGVLSINIASTGGMQITSDNLEIKLNSGVSGLNTTANGLALDSSMAGTGLTFTTGVLSVNTIDLTSASGNGVSGLLPIANGGTNASTEAAARLNLAFTPAGYSTSQAVLARIAASDCSASSGSTSVTTVTHNFATNDVVVQVYDTVTNDTVIADVVRANTNAVTVTINGASIVAGDYRIVVTG